MNQDEFYTLNKNSLRDAYNRVLDMHTNFPPFTKAQLVDIITQLVSDLPYEGTIKERSEFIKKTIDEFIENDDGLVLLGGEE